MSNKNNNARKYQQSEKQAEKHWGKFWIGLICFVLVLAVLFGVTVWRTSGFKDWSFGFGGNTQVETKDPADNDGQKVQRITRAVIWSTRAKTRAYC